MQLQTILKVRFSHIRLSVQIDGILDVNIVKTDDTSATTVSESNLLDKTREGSFDLPVRAQGEINLTGFDITKFYGDFALSKRKYIGQVDERRTRNYPSRFQALSMSEVIAYEYKCRFFSPYASNH